MPETKLTIKAIIDRKREGGKITVLTAYDASFARLLDQAGIDILLVGDSLGMVVLGYDSTVPVTLEEMLHHARAVGRGRQRSLLVGDMPFLSYQSGPRDAILNGGRFLKEARCDAVKVEGGAEIADTVRAMVRAGIPVMGHIGLTPQTASQLGGFRVQGRDAASARQLIAAARSLEEAGAFAVVLECIPDQLAGMITRQLAIPTIGIGAGPGCDGQVLVTHDLLGLFEKFVPRFVKQYANLAPMVKEAVASFRAEVEAGTFPAAAHCFPMQIDPATLEAEKEEEVRT
ncbi:MAG: 3-methyl-2-oxobutanoate hydroxymethyltransferase [Desulfobacteraceae bacterium]|nr:3-methyl-2-oxobutanoate hydroxymethyltransferase [Desulfobacteraceae bacterium]